MINPFKEINWRPQTPDIVAFGRSLVIGGAILLTAVTACRMFLAPSGGTTAVLQMLFCLLIICGFSAVFLPSISKPLYYVWFFFGACVGIVVSNVILILFYYLFFTPIALVVRLRGRDPLTLRRATAPNSTWTQHKTEKDLSRYYKQY